MNRLLLILSFLLAATPLFADWSPPVINYTRHHYQAGTQNWMCTQQENGWIYAANNKGLLEYDGVNWRLYPMNNAKMRAVHKGVDGNIYAGGFTHFGYFEPDNLGNLHFRILSDKVHTGVNNIGVVRNILSDTAAVYFQADRYLFIKRAGEEVKQIDYGKQIHCSTLFNGRFYIASEEGLCMLEDNRFLPVAGAELLGVLHAVALVPSENTLLIITRAHGIYTFDGKQFKPLPLPAADAFLRNKQMYSAALCGSLLAVGSVQAGVGIINLQTGNIRHISTEQGLQNNTVYALHFDTDGNLWLMLDNGIDHMRIHSDLTALGGNRAYIGSGYASCSYRGRLYLATNQGIYHTALPRQDGPDDEPQLVHDTEGQAWSFLVHDGKLFCATENGVFVIDDAGMAMPVGDIKGVRRLTALPGRPDVLIAGTYGVERGLHLLQKQDGRWTAVSQIKNCNLSCKSLLAEDGRHLWVTTKNRGVHRLFLSDDLQEVKQERWYQSFPVDHEMWVTRLGSQIAVASHYGLWRFSQEADSLVAYTEMENLLDGNTAYTYIAMDELRNIWYATGGAMKLLSFNTRTEQYAHQADAFLHGAMIENFESVSVMDTLVIISTEDGFARLHLPVARHAKRRPLSPYIRNVYLTGLRDSLIYGRSYRYDASPLVIPYRRNSIRIEYGATNYGSVTPTLYSYRLSSGNDKSNHWSEFSEINMKEFTDLTEGRYTFSVRLMNIEGNESAATDFHFQVLPPWYRTWWSYLLYVCTVALVVYYSYRRLTSQKKELKEENRRKDEKIGLLEEENLQAELRHKSEELLRTTLNIVRKNEMLLEIKKEVVGVSRSFSEEDAVAVRRKLLRLQGQIETNIEHDADLQTFQASFDSVHHDFFRNLAETYPDLTSKEKLLCAYIKMDLLTKEIAPLLNISVRGVEISRYRLRKKLNLDERENLQEFLQQFGK